MLPPLRVMYIWQLLFLKPNCQKMVVYEENFFTTELSYRGVQGEVSKGHESRKHDQCQVLLNNFVSPIVMLLSEAILVSIFLSLTPYKLGSNGNQ